MNDFIFMISNKHRYSDFLSHPTQTAPLNHSHNLTLGLTHIPSNPCKTFYPILIKICTQCGFFIASGSAKFESDHTFTT